MPSSPNYIKMKALISESNIEGSVRVPASKSYTLRALMCAALAGGVSEIIAPLSADDTEAAASVLSQIGVNIDRSKGAWHIHGGHFHRPESDLFCADSAGTLRFMTAICSLVPGRCRLTAGASLSHRPVKPLTDALGQLGVSCASNAGLPPVVVEGGDFKGGAAALPGNVSSQFVSALLMVGPLARDGITIDITPPLESRPYVLMTLDCMGKFGVRVTSSADMLHYEIKPQKYRPARYMVEGDWSSASYLLALGVLAGTVTVENLNYLSLQGDRALLDIIRDMGAFPAVDGASIKVNKSRLKAIDVDLADCIDLLPTVAVLAAVADGISRLSGIGRARLKESNRVVAMREGLERMGIKVTEGKDNLVIVGGQPTGAIIDSKADHRIAMAFSVLGALVGETVIEGAECVSKTFPDYWQLLNSLGGKVELI